MRRTLLTLIPKLALSRTTGIATRLPLPRALRARAYGWFARRYGAALDEVDGDVAQFRSFAEFFARPLRGGARPLGDAALSWPCDGKIVTCGPIADDRIPQVKGVTYGIGELVADANLAQRLRGGSQATIYLAPGDYHRVHTPFDACLTGLRSIRGTLFPVNPPAVAAIPGLFVRNARKVFEFELDAQRVGAVVMVGALNVGSIVPSASVGDRLTRGAELGRFGFGSTVVVLLDANGPGFGAMAPETRVTMGRDARLDERQPT